ncbi:hypothetical protein PHET_10864 [Paragonimus heterotremus]|uniref:Uncharacterized protein n=1 Tax=Paragonimus heterotremus TaxID=100268 RepID=A0A8J4WML8_9TREM|nr:hypothetical protein PHET_10864 [Paragonimus heterotremus]
MAFYTMFKPIFVLVLCTAVVCPLQNTSHGVKSDALNRDPGSFADWEQKPMISSKMNLEELKKSDRKEKREKEKKEKKDKREKDRKEKKEKRQNCSQSQ